MRSLSTRAAGLLILALGIWGGVIPFVGPYFHFTLGPDRSWTWTTGRLYLDILPAIAAVIGGLLLLGAGPRPSGRLGALLALAGGIWFAIGPDISLLWNSAGAQGAAHGARDIRMLESLSYHTGLGVLIAALAGYALPGFLRPRREPVPVGAGVGAGAGAATGAGAGAYAAERGMTRHEERAATRREMDREEVAPEETAVRDREEAGVREPVGVGAPATARHEPAAAGGTVADGSGAPVGDGRGAPVGDGRGAPVGDGRGGYADPQYADAPQATGTRRRGGLLSIFSRR